jgi:hypothetical protein
MKPKRRQIAKKSIKPVKTKGAQLTTFWGLGLPEGKSVRSNGARYEQPLHKNPETKEQREKRLAKREALTLKAFQIAYENHHQRKAS